MRFKFLNKGCDGDDDDDDDDDVEIKIEEETWTSALRAQDVYSVSPRFGPAGPPLTAFLDLFTVVPSFFIGPEEPTRAKGN